MLSLERERRAARLHARRRLRGRIGVPRARRSLGRRQEHHPARVRGPRAAGARPGRVRRRRPGSTPTRGVWVEPEDRACGFVFQDYALFPHMPAWQNVAYGMRTSPPRPSGAARPRSCSSASASRDLADAQPAVALGRRAPAGRARARACDVAAGAAARRAARGARRAHARRRRARARRRAAGGRGARAARHARLRRRGPARRRGRDRRPRQRTAARLRRATWPLRRPPRSSRTSPARACSRATRTPAAGGLTACGSTAAARSSAPTAPAGARPRACSRGR